jgi:hypothetical protein
MNRKSCQWYEYIIHRWIGKAANGLNIYFIPLQLQHTTSRKILMLHWISKEILKFLRQKPAFPSSDILSVQKRHQGLKIKTSSFRMFDSITNSCSLCSATSKGISVYGFFFFSSKKTQYFSSILSFFWRVCFFVFFLWIHQCLDSVSYED